MAEKSGALTDRMLVVGGSGRFAGLVLPALSRRGVRPVAMVRTPEQAERARRLGAGEAVLGDLRDRESLNAALSGVTRAFYISPVFQEDEAEMGVGFVDAAMRAGVDRIVFSSVIHPSLDLRNHAAKRPIENALYESGLDQVVLRPAIFYQNLAAAWPVMREHGVLAEPFSAAARIARVDYRDVAEVAAIALTEDRLLDGAYELCADRGRNREEVAAIASRIAGRPIRAESPGFEAWAERTGLPYDAGQTRQLAAMYANYDRQGLRGNPLTLRAILGREPRSLEDFFADLMAGTPTIAA